MSINKFDESENANASSNDDNSSDNSDKKYESIRQKNKRNYSESKETGDEKNSTFTFSYSFDERTNYSSNFNDMREIYIDQKLKLDLYKKQNIDKFLFTKAPVPRSYRMIGKNEIKLYNNYLRSFGFKICIFG